MTTILSIPAIWLLAMALGECPRPRRLTTTWRWKKSRWAAAGAKISLERTELEREKAANSNLCNRIRELESSIGATKSGRYFNVESGPRVCVDVDARTVRMARGDPRLAQSLMENIWKDLANA